MTYSVRLFLSVLLAAPLAASASASATAETRPSYPYKLIVLGAGSGSYAAAINKAGQMTGVIPGVSDHVFIYTAGVLNDIGTLPGFQSSVGVGINNAGEVVGGALGQGQISHGFVYSGGTFRDIGTLGGGMTGALDINDAGDIVGSSVLQEHFPFAFLYRNGVMRNLGCLPGSDRSNAQAINDKGVIAGSSGVGPAQGPNGNQSHAVIWKQTAPTRSRAPWRSTGRNSCPACARR
jgi:probable HAF family extracellular repeat protein